MYRSIPGYGPLQSSLGTCQCELTLAALDFLMSAPLSTPLAAPRSNSLNSPLALHVASGRLCHAHLFEVPCGSPFLGPWAFLTYWLRLLFCWHGMIANLWSLAHCWLELCQGFCTRASLFLAFWFRLSGLFLLFGATERARGYPA